MNRALLPADTMDAGQAGSSASIVRVSWTSTRMLRVRVRSLSCQDTKRDRSTPAAHA